MLRSQNKLYITLVVFLFSCSHYVADLVKKTGIVFNGKFSFIED